MVIKNTKSNQKKFLVEPYFTFSGKIKGKTPQWNTSHQIKLVDTKNNFFYHQNIANQLLSLSFNIFQRVSIFSPNHKN